MNSTVEYKSRAENDLATIWMAASEREAGTVASAQLDAWLGDAALFHGESRRSSVHRVAFCPPLGLEYEVVEDDKRVLVQAVFRVA